MLLDEGNDPWLVFVAAHDRFHDVAAATLAKRANAGTLRPTKLDLRLRAEEERVLEERESHRRLLLALLDALERAVVTGEDALLDTKAVGLPSGSITVGASEVSGSDGWDGGTAHQHEAIYSISLSLTDLHWKDRDWATNVLVSFLAADPSRREDLYDQAAGVLTVAVLLTNAELIQLLADREPSVYEPGTCQVPEPEVLHYADRYAITKSFVNGEAIRTVCGQWFVPRGDDQTHANLPVCPECEQELPAAQGIRELLRGRV